ncbi:MAG: DUF4388 domain-containing protein [Myxococcota bacterium]
MALRGTVTDYGLADVLQLVVSGGRTGLLRMERGNELIDVYLRSGVIVDARAGSTADGPLGARLVQAGVLSEEQLGLALADRVETGRSLGEVLLDRDWIDEGLLRAQATLQRWELIMAPFTWEDGEYALSDGEPEAESDWAEPIQADQMLRKGLRLIEEWPAASRAVPSRLWTVARRLPLPPATTDIEPFAAVFGAPEDPTQPDDVSEEARWVHALCAPGVSVGRVIGRSPVDRFETTLGLAELASRGYIVLMPP